MRRLPLALLLISSSAFAQPSPGPQPIPMPPPIAAPQDIPFPGTIVLAVNATDTERRIVTVHETVPVPGGARTTLLFPEWVPGAHSAVNPLPLMAGLIVHGGGQRLAWVRDTVNVHAMHVDVPSGVTALDLDFQYLSPTDDAQGAVSIAPNLMKIDWLQNTLYPAGWFARRIPVDATLTLPKGWRYGVALETASRTGDVVRFKTTTLETLMDSPLIAGRYYQDIDLDPGAPVRVTMAMAADRPEDLVIKPEQLAPHRALVQQAYRLFGSHHYDHYTFLFWQSNTMDGAGTEHHQSSEDGLKPGYFSDWEKNLTERTLFSHEYTHSWDGKFRRPADLWTPSYEVPMRDSLLWVYEGQTQYWGEVLAARSGLYTKQDALDSLALTAATYDLTPGRAWKPLADTTNDPIVNERRPSPWRSWQRSEDYYEEGRLIWFDVDTRIREGTKGKRSLDDFARAFFGIDNGSYVVRTYTFDDVVAGLNAVMPYDWATYLRTRLTTNAPGAPLDGLARGGYRLVYTDKPTAFFKSAEGRLKGVNLSFGPGFGVGREGALSGVIWDSAAFKAGLTNGTKLIAVNGTAYDGDRLKDAVAATAKGVPLELTVRDGDRVRTVKLDYTGGLRYPRLERIAGTPDRLGEIFAPRVR